MKKKYFSFARKNKKPATAGNARDNLCTKKARKVHARSAGKDLDKTH